MRTSMRVKQILAPTFLTLAVLGLGTGCSDAAKALGGECGSGDAGVSLTAKFDAFKGAVDALGTAEASITSKVALACVNIAKDLDPTADVPTVTAGQKVSEADTKKACDAASAAIVKVKADGNLTVTLAYSAPVCTVDAKAQVDCNANCNVSASCTAPDIKTACEPGHLSGGCSGACEGTCTANVEASATCSGTCNGTCEGTCNGQAGTAGNGVACNGTCSAGCKGTCEATASADVKCEGSCKGSCDVAFTAPKCDVAITPPKCDAAADCNAGCNGSASLKATCTKPEVSVVIAGGASATLETTLKTNLPAILEVAAQAKLAADSVATLGTTAISLVGAFTAEAGCAVKYGADFATKLTAAATASVNVQASFSASASVSGSASGSTSH